MNVNCFNDIQKSMIHDLGSRHNGISNRLDTLKAVAIAALEICVFQQMVHGASWKSISTKMILVTIQMGVSFVWSPFLLGLFHQWRRVIIAWCVHFVMICFLLKFLWFLLTPWWTFVFMLNCLFFSKHKQVASCECSCCHQNYAALTLTFWKQQENISHLNMSEIIHMNPIQRYRAVSSRKCCSHAGIYFIGHLFLEKTE